MCDRQDAGNGEMEMRRDKQNLGDSGILSLSCKLSLFVKSEVALDLWRLIFSHYK